MSSTIALVTGAASGIGKAISNTLLQSNYQVILVDSAVQNLTNTYQEFINSYSQAQVIKLVCNVGSSSCVNTLINELDRNNLIPGILINNAGYGGPFQTIDEITDEEWDKVINTNLRSIFNFSRKLLPYMQNNQWGKIINIASIQGLIGASLSSTYIASKHGVIGYTKAIASEWGKYGITCNAICPGYVNTSMGVQENSVLDHQQKIIARTPLGKIANPQDIAQVVEFLISDKASFMNGSIVTVDGGILADVGIT